MSKHAIVKLLPGRQRRAKLGHPWIYSNEIDMDATTKAIKPGTLVELQTNYDESLGIAIFNPKNLICGRILTTNIKEKIDAKFFEKRIKKALELREILFDTPYYRLIHAESDNMPGVIIDRFDDTFVCQFNTPGMEALSTEILAALDKVCAPTNIVLRNDSSYRQMAGLEQNIAVEKGSIDGPIIVKEGKADFFINPIEGQKTGWFYDQRDNRMFMASLAKNRDILDVYCFTGGFSIQAALHGAKSVKAVDRSKLALEMAQKSAKANKVDKKCEFIEQEAFAFLDKENATKAQYDVVIVDPPAFVKSKKDLQVGAKGYRKLARYASTLVKPGGFFFMASCSYNMSPELFLEQIRMGLSKSGRTGRIIRSASAAADHPAHPFLPESDYLCAYILQID